MAKENRSYWDRFKEWFRENLVQAEKSAPATSNTPAEPAKQDEVTPQATQLSDDVAEALIPSPKNEAVVEVKAKEDLTTLEALKQAFDEKYPDLDLSKDPDLKERYDAAFSEGSSKHERLYGLKELSVIVGSKDMGKDTQYQQQLLDFAVNNFKSSDNPTMYKQAQSDLLYVNSLLGIETAKHTPASAPSTAPVGNPSPDPAVEASEPVSEKSSEAPNREDFHMEISIGNYGYVYYRFVNEEGQELQDLHDSKATQKFYQDFSRELIEKIGHNPNINYDGTAEFALYSEVEDYATVQDVIEKEYKARMEIPQVEPEATNDPIEVTLSDDPERHESMEAGETRPFVDGASFEVVDGSEVSETTAPEVVAVNESIEILQQSFESFKRFANKDLGGGVKTVLGEDIGGQGLRFHINPSVFEGNQDQSVVLNTQKAFAETYGEMIEKVTDGQAAVRYGYDHEIGHFVDVPLSDAKKFKHEILGIKVEENAFFETSAGKKLLSESSKDLASNPLDSHNVEAYASVYTAEDGVNYVDINVSVISGHEAAGLYSDPIVSAAILADNIGEIAGNDVYSVTTDSEVGYDNSSHYIRIPASVFMEHREELVGQLGIDDADLKDAFTGSHEFEHRIIEKPESDKPELAKETDEKPGFFESVWDTVVGTVGDDLEKATSKHPLIREELAIGSFHLDQSDHVMDGKPYVEMDLFKGGGTLTSGLLNNLELTVSSSGNKSLRDFGKSEESLVDVARENVPAIIESLKEMGINAKSDYFGGNVSVLVDAEQFYANIDNEDLKNMGIEPSHSIRQRLEDFFVNDVKIERPGLKDILFDEGVKQLKKTELKFDVSSSSDPHNDPAMHDQIEAGLAELEGSEVLQQVAANLGNETPTELDPKEDDPVLNNNNGLALS